MKKLKIMEPKNVDLETLMGLAEMLATEEADGHLTLMRLTTGWKAFLQTPNLDAGSGREEVANMQTHSTLKEALIALFLYRAKGKK